MSYRVRSLCLSLLLLFALELPAAEFRVVVTAKPVHSVLSALMQDLESPRLLIGKGQLPLTYQPSDSDRQVLRQADLVIWVGPELEQRIAPEIRKLPASVRVMTLLDEPKLKVLPARGAAEGRDPYFWLDSRNMLILLDYLTEVLVEQDPGRAHVYTRNRRLMLQRMSQLDRELEYGYRGLRGGAVLAYSDTLQYFEQAYALKVGAVLSMPGQPVQAVDLLKARMAAEKGQFGCLLLERGVEANQKDVLFEGESLPVVYLDSFGLGYEPGPDLYLDLMRHNTDALKRCVRPEADSNDRQAEAQPAPDGIRGRFMLMDQDGKLFRDSDMLGKYQLVYFGYTFCPDVCPTSLGVMNQALQLLGDDSAQIQPYFITIDPDRDTVEVMKRYVGYFNERLVGLTGSQAMIDRVADQFKVRYEKVVEPGADPQLYLMDHSASVFLMAPDGSYITQFVHGVTPEQMVKGIRSYLR